MCTRYNVDPLTREFEEILEEAERSALIEKFRAMGMEMKTSGEIRPTDVVPVIAKDRSGKKKVFPMKWGFRIKEGPVTVNARVESASEKASFRESWRKRRCIIPASSYFEWEHLDRGDGKKSAGSKYSISPKGQEMTWLCGLYRMEDGLPVFTVLTRDASEDVAALHDRMPLMLPEDMITEWLDSETDPDTVVKFALTSMTLEKVKEKDPGEEQLSLL